MERREFIKSGAAVALGGLAPGRNPMGKIRRPPNVLFAFSDQQRAVSFPGEPFNSAIAPNLERFRRESFAMNACISNYPLCTPYRGMLMSGRWPHQTGMTHNGAHLSPDERTLGHLFHDAGYRTGYVGKWHLHGEDDAESTFIPPGPLRLGFEDWHAWSMTNNHYHSWTYDPITGERIYPEGWNATRMTDQAVAFIESRPADRPWFLMVSWNPPHHPYNPPDAEQNLYAPEKLELRPNVRLSLKGLKVTGTDHALTSDEALRTQMRGYLGGITGIDAEFQRLLDTLEKTGQAQDTIVVFTSDHGEMIGSHGRTGKSVPFEESCRVPFMVRYPGATVRGASTKRLMSTIDIYPTLCGLAGIPVPGHCAGKDISAAMRGEKCVTPEMVFLLHQLSGGDGRHDRFLSQDEETARLQLSVHPPSYRAVRTEKHTYAATKEGRWLLFDNIADPYQMQNLAGKPEMRALMDEFDKALAQWMKKTGDDFQLPGDRIAGLPA